MNPYTAAQFQSYREMQLQTASPTELVVMLYRGAVRFARAGVEGVKRNDIAAANTGFVRAQQIVSELSATLDFERGGALAAQLRAIYTFVNQLLIEANVQKQVKPAQQAISLLEELQSAWEQVNHAEIVKTLAPVAA
jgi:flagellar protein FliS